MFQSQRQVVHLADEDACHGQEECSAVHVDVSAYGQHEATLHNKLVQNLMAKIKHLQNGSELRKAQRQVVHLADEDAGHGQEERSAIHVDVAAYGQHEASDARVHAETTFHRTKCNG